MKTATAVLFAVACATSTANGANLRSSAEIGEVARLMGRNTMYTGVVDMLRKDAPATAIMKKLDSMKVVLQNRREQVKEGCALDNTHFENDYERTKGNVTEVSATIESKKMCIDSSSKKENEVTDTLTKTMKDLVPQAKFTRAKERLEQIRARAAKLVGEHKSRTERYNKEAEMFKAQDKILTHVMTTIENYYKHKSEASKKESTVQTVLLETVAPKSHAHKTVVTKLLEIVSKKAPKKSKVLAGQIYEAMQELKNTFEDERTKRTARYEARKGEHSQEIERLTAEESQINTDVKEYLGNNKKVTATAEKLKKEIASITEKIVGCKKAMTEENKRFSSLTSQLKTREAAMQRTKKLCAGQLKDIDKEVELAEHIISLIDKRVHHIQQALVKYEKEANGGDESMTGMATGAVGDLEKQIKSTEDCAKYSKEFWCASEHNMKQCGVDADQCRLMNRNGLNTAFATGTSAGSISGAAGSASGATGSASGATGPVSATAVAAKTKKEHDFERVLRVFDQNKNRKIGIEEIAAVKGKRIAEKVKPVFKKNAGPDGQMDRNEFHNFMNGGGKKFFFF